MPGQGTPGQGTPGQAGTGQAGTGQGGVQATRALRHDGQAVRGVAPWVRAFTERLHPALPPLPPGIRGPWRLRAATAQPLGKLADTVFDHDPDAACVLAVVSDPAGPGGVAILLDAAREAAGTGQLVVLTSVAGVAGFCASLQAEHPSLGVTVIQTADSAAGLRAARPFAAATPGRFRELVVDEAGLAREVAMLAAEPAGGGPFPLGPADVVLVSGMAGWGELACAAALTGRGAALAVIAPPGPEDPRLAAFLADVRASGTRVGRKKADPTDPGQVAAAVRSLERGLGPVTAVVYAAAAGPIERALGLPEAGVRNVLAGQRARLGNVLRAVAMERVRLLVTFGSIAARYGRVDGACDALLSGQLAGQAARLVAGWPRCRVLHVDWPRWAEQEPAHGQPRAAAPRPVPIGAVLSGHVPARDAPSATAPSWPVPAGPVPSGPVPSGNAPPGHLPRAEEAPPITVAEGSRLLLDVLATPDFPCRIAIHGRAGVPVPAAVRPGPGAAVPRGRFLEEVRVHYPGVELVTDARLSLRADPYLSDHRIDGLPVLPVSLALEAMAQAASVLAGEPRRHVSELSVPAPVVLPDGSGDGGCVIRVCALRDGDAVETVLRCSETSFQVDHARAVFGPGATPGPGGSSGQGTAAEDGRGFAGLLTGGGDTSPGGIVDGTDLYGPVYFQTGRFRRVAFLPEVSSRSCRALVRGGDDQPWFGTVTPVDSPLILGSPGLNDATLHVLQACLPHRRVLPAGCASATFSGHEVRGALQVHAVRRPAGTGGEVWDVAAVDATGLPVSVWTGLRLLDVGPLARSAPWHPSLLTVSLEVRAAELGIDPSLRAIIRTGVRAGRLPADVPATGSGAPGPWLSSLPGGQRPASPAAPGRPVAPPELPPPDGWGDTAAGHGPLDGFELTVRATRPVACRWEAVTPPSAPGGLPDPLPGLRQHLGSRSQEAPGAAHARLLAIAACLSALGYDAATGPRPDPRPGAGTPTVLAEACDGGWLVVQVADTRVACAVVEISGVPTPVALAVATRQAGPGQGQQMMTGTQPRSR